MIERILVATVVIFCVVSAKNLGHQGWKVLRIEPKDEKQNNDLLELTKLEELDFWTDVNSHGKPVDVLIPPHLESDTQDYLSSHGINFKILINNLQKELDDDFAVQSRQPSLKHGRISFTKYNDFTEINNYIKQIAKDHSDIVSLQQIGKTVEGREINVLKISTDPSANKPIIFIDGGIHAREWIAPATTTYAVQQLVENSANRHLLDKVDWHIVAVINPDGYQYTHASSSNRMWRKTRSRGNRCYGADANRNFDFKWGGLGTSGDECSDIYRGSSPSSELETQALSKYLLSQKNVKLYLSFHSYGNYVLYPWGYSTELPENADELQALGESVGNSMGKVLGNRYTVGSSATALYPAAGGSDDWAKAISGVELAYTIELSAGGTTGFNPPPSKIVPYVTEGWEGLKAYHNYIANKFGL